MKTSRFALLFLAAAASLSRADIAVLHEKGPKAGSLMANPGVSQSSPKNLKITLRQAEVKISLRPAGGGNLAADVTASFQLEDHASMLAGTRTFLVAFPVTGLRSQVMAVKDFRVSVDGNQPPLVLRRTVRIGYNRYNLEDTAVARQLDERFAPDKEPSQTGVCLADETAYDDAYVWTQSSKPGSKTSVAVAYTAILKPQEISYSKSYQPSEDDNEVIPFDDIEVPKWDEKYFLFDYVLLSGATWEGPIGSEMIEFAIDPSLKLSASRIDYTLRSPVGRAGGRRERPAPHSSNSIEVSWSPDGDLRLGFHDEKPRDDLLFSIPVSAVALPDQAPAK